MKNKSKVFGLAIIAAIVYMILPLTGCSEPESGNSGNDITYSVFANDSFNTTAINFDFSAAVSGLTAGDITVANGTGSVTKGALTGSGTSWSLAVSVFVNGNVKVSIAKSGIQSGNKTVAVADEFLVVIPPSQTFDSIDAMWTWLTAQPDNTAATFYPIKLNVNNLSGGSSTSGSVGYALASNSTKYVYLDLSDSTFTDITNGAFQNTNLTGLIIPNGVTTIGTSAFNGCASLAGVKIPDSVTSIGYSAFENCASLANINIPNTVTTIGAGAFKNCASLTTVSIPNRVTIIAQSAFSGCTGLISVTIPDIRKIIHFN